MKKIITALALTGILIGVGSTMNAATTGTIPISAQVPAINDLQITLDNPQITDLGQNVQTDKDFANITIFSNNDTGFIISLTSKGENPGFMTKSGIGVGATDTQKIAYTVKLQKSVGTLGTGLTAPADLNDAKTLLSTQTDYDFSGTAASITDGYTLNLLVSTNQKNLEEGEYSDTIQVDIADS